MEKIDYITLNEILEEYLEKHQATVYCNHLFYFFDLSNEIQRKCSPFCDEEGRILSFKIYNFQSQKVDLIEGMSLIEKYLENIGEDLRIDFIKKLRNGQIEIHYQEDESEEILEDGFMRIKKEIETCKKDEWVNIQAQPSSLIDVKNEKTSYRMLMILLHEYIHSVILDKKKNEQEKEIFLQEFYAIYFELDFLKYLREHGLPQEEYMNHLFERYQATIIDNLSLIIFSCFLFKKQEEGVIDQESYHLGKIRTDERTYQLDAQVILDKDKKNKLVNPSSYAEYVFGTALAYYLIQKEDATQTKRVIQSMKEDTKGKIVEALGITFYELEPFNLKKSLFEMRQEILENTKEEYKQGHR